MSCEVCAVCCSICCAFSVLSLCVSSVFVFVGVYLSLLWLFLERVALRMVCSGCIGLCVVLLLQGVSVVCLPSSCFMCTASGLSAFCCVLCSGLCECCLYAFCVLHTG